MEHDGQRGPRPSPARDPRLSPKSDHTGAPSWIGGFRLNEGVDEVINRKEDDIARAVNDSTHGRGVDVVVDPVGGPSYEASTKCIAFEGRIVVLGFTSGSIPSAALSHAMIKNYSIHGLHWGSYVKRDEYAWREANRQLAELNSAGHLRSIRVEHREFSSVPEGLARIASGTSIGKQVFAVNPWLLPDGD